MDASTMLHRRVSAWAVTAVCVAALGTAEHAVRARLQGTAPPRPVADAPVDVVKAPPEPATDRLPIRACRTCALGANGATL